MKYLRFLALGILFGIVLMKSQVTSWFRIYEMFQFDSFHMYGIIGSAVAIGLVGVLLIKKMGWKDFDGNAIQYRDKNKSVPRYLIGGIIFGLGWALSGACPGPMFVLLGSGFYLLLIVILGAVIGTFVYGLVRDRLPH